MILEITLFKHFTQQVQVNFWEKKKTNLIVANKRNLYLVFHKWFSLFLFLYLLKTEEFIL